MEPNYYTTSNHADYLGFSPEDLEANLFQFALPVPPTLDATKRKGWAIEIKEGTTWFGIGDSSGTDYTTTVWGYALPGQDAGYLGPTFLAKTGSPVWVNWKNLLPQDGHLLPVDVNLHWAEPTRFTLEDGYVPTVTHLHGGHNRSDSDGLPDQWAVQHNKETGHLWERPVFTYDNDQQAATLWYHDHALGITRLNVYAGLAGFYLLTDEVEQNLVDPPGDAAPTLPGPAFDIPMAIQDKAFTPDGQLYYPAHDGDVLPGTEDTVEVPDDPGFVGDASIMPEFFGNIITVNGMAWPEVEVDGDMWRFRLLNGSDSRFYLLDFEDSDPDADPAAYLVGTDGGLLPNAIELTDRFVLEPGGRLDIVLDFAGLASGAEVILKNSGPAFEPFKGLTEDGELAGDAVAADAIELDAHGDPVLVDNIVMFTVGEDVPGNEDIQLSGGTPLNTSFVDITTAVPDKVRKVGLFEGEDEFGRIQALLGTAEEGALHSDLETPDGAFGPLHWDAPVTETPELGALEHWEIFNFTEDAHPIHLHLVQYQIIEKVRFDFIDEDENGVPDDRPDPEAGPDGVITYGYASEGDTLDDPLIDILIYDTEPVPLRPEDSGWHDTAWVGPREMLRIAAEFDRPGEYVWHCHILSHEDHEMMRPFLVEEAAVA